MPNLKYLIHSTRSKEDNFKNIKHGLEEMGLKVTGVNQQKPWGGYLLIDSTQTERFIEIFFADFPLPNWLKNKYLSPKVMLWAPNEILSWQYHNRRHEYWKVIKGPVLAYLSEEDILPENPQLFEEGTLIEIPLGIRHRGGGLSDWGIIAELWGHSDPANLSDEEDIVRLADKYLRQTPQI